MRFLVTGASGFVGGALAKHLSSRGYDVTVLVRRTSKRDALEKIAGLKFAIGDLLSGEGLDEAVAGVDAVMHLAGVTKARTAEEYQRGNADGTRRLCAAMAQLPKPPRMVFCSSLAAAGPTTRGKPKTEADDPAPISIYGRSKLGAEMAVRAFADKLPAIIVRPPVVYGPGDEVNVPPLFPMGKLGVYVKPGLTPKHLSFIHVDDLCEALLLAALRGKTLAPEDPAQGVYFVSDPREYTYDDFFHAFSRALGKRRPTVVSLPDAVGYAVGLTNELAGRLAGAAPILNRDKALEMSCEAWTCSPQRAQHEIAFEPSYALEEGLEHTVAWYRKEGWL